MLTSLASARLAATSCGSSLSSWVNLTETLPAFCLELTGNSMDYRKNALHWRSFRLTNKIPNWISQRSQGSTATREKRLFSRPTEHLWVATCVHNTLHTPCGPQRELYEWCNLSRGSLPSAGFPLSIARRKQPLSLTFLPCPPAPPAPPSVPLHPPHPPPFLQKEKNKNKNGLPPGPNSCRRGDVSEESPPTPPTAMHNAFHMLAQEPRGTLYLTSGTDHLCNGHSRPQTIRL